jgi:lysophospholipase L1-like esterase
MWLELRLDRSTNDILFAPQLASRPNVIVLDEHLFEALERPELFGDPLHLNGAGMVKFSRVLAAAVRDRLGSSRR